MAPESSEAELMKAVAAVAPKKQRKLRPARKQVKFGDVVKVDTPQTGKEYNIWYNKWAGGDREDNYSNKVKSQTRCNIKRDSGLTRANVTGMKYTCLYFARGCCPYGWECDYLHQLPDPDDQLPDTSKDCFAREKFADYRDDMGGVGSFNRQNRTLLRPVTSAGPPSLGQHIRNDAPPPHTLRKGGFLATRDNITFLPRGERHRSWDSILCLRAALQPPRAITILADLHRAEPRATRFQDGGPARHDAPSPPSDD
uniref:Cell cycle control protein n=1 Tax=Mycena chlorophos TaxID=658473 RepID=A0ABQ0LU55_MYCCL|nr:cell cycle control protein [Mycena chlorophos]